ncbi:MAG: cytochrome c oxidase subunit 3 family protein, partial [Pirellulales bacterium]
PVAASAGHVAHHFDDAEQQYASAELGMWLFLATEVLFFGGVFCAYAVYRYWYPEAFAEGSHHLDLPLGTVNTAILLLSSLTMALAVRAAQTSEQRAIVRNLGFTVLLGLGFLGIKSYEYYHKFEERLVPGPNFVTRHPELAQQPGGESRYPPPAEVKEEPRYKLSSTAELFFSLYFVMTGLHALHMVIGIGILGVLIVAAVRGAFSAAYFTPVELAGLYWHFVDIVWVFLFPLLYLIH